jgi:membrane protease YdiL (CAAX protease family)
MTANRVKQIILVGMTIAVVLLIGGSLLGSLGEPQVNDRLQLYQTDLLLQATELRDPNSADEVDLGVAQRALLGDQPLNDALEQYEKVRQSAAANLDKFEKQLSRLAPNVELETESAPPAVSSLADTAETKQVRNSIQQQQLLINQLDLRIGILQAEQGNSDAALNTWANVNDANRTISQNSLSKTATVLTGLWSTPPRILPDAESLLQRNLEGWFRYRALSRLYQLQQRSDSLSTLQATEQEIAQQTIVKLALVGVLPTLGGIAGFILLIGFTVRRLLRKPTDTPEDLSWQVPWTWETILQVLILGFFLVGQVALPLLLGGLGFNFSAFGSRARAVYTLTYYLLMAGTGLLVLYLSIRPYFPFPEDWFRLKGKRNWLVWGVGGYLVALPLMLGVSLVNQQIWQGQGGSNPLLQTVLEEGDGVALALFFVTAAIAAPVFEELLFRGFLLPSLTKYVSPWAAIGFSALLFAVAHLSLSEVLPLAMLGGVLGYIYTQSRSLLAPMLLHSLWNSVTMLGLLILGSGNG